MTVYKIKPLLLYYIPLRPYAARLWQVGGNFVIPPCRREREITLPTSSHDNKLDRAGPLELSTRNRMQHSINATEYIGVQRRYEMR